MDIYPWNVVSERIRAAAAEMRRVDTEQEAMTTHRLDAMEPVARVLEEVAGLLEGGMVGAATRRWRVVVDAVSGVVCGDEEQEQRRLAAARMGAARSEKKAVAARENGKRGGRPKKKERNR